MTRTVEGPDGTSYEFPEPGETVDLTISAEVVRVAEARGRAPVLVFSFAPATDRLGGFEYHFYPWEVNWDVE